MLKKLKTFMNLLRFYRAIGHLAANPTWGAIFLVKHPKKNLFKVVLYRRHVSAKYDMYGITNPEDRLGGRDYRIVLDQIEWPFPTESFPNGFCPTCYQRIKAEPQELMQ